MVTSPTDNNPIDSDLSPEYQEPEELLFGSEQPSQNTPDRYPLCSPTKSDFIRSDHKYSTESPFQDSSQLIDARSLKLGGSSLKSDAFWSLLGNGIYMVCQWSCSVAIAKLCTSQSLGQFALGLAITAPIYLFFGLQLRSVQATDAEREMRFSLYLSLRLLTTLSALSVSLLIVSVALYLSLFSFPTSSVVILVALAKSIESLSDIFFGMIQQNERMSIVGKSLILKGFISVFLVVISLFLSHSVVVAVIALCLAWGLVLVFWDIPQGVRLHRERYDHQILSLHKIEALSRLILKTLPLGVVVLFISLGPAVPRFIIGSSRGVSELGIYSAICYAMVVGQAIISPLGQAASPRLSKYFLAGDRRGFIALLTWLFSFAGALGIAGILVSYTLGESLLRVVYSDEYSSYSGSLIIIMMAALIQYIATVAECGVTSARVFREQLYPAIYALIAVGISSILLIPKLGILGGSLAILLSQCVTLWGRLLVLRDVIRRLDRGRFRAGE